MSLPSVSVVIPCCNAAAFVADAVASVWAQTQPPLEIICVDDGSADDTLRVLQRLQAASSLPFQLLAGVNRGASHARNRGTACASGDYIQYLDADDVLQPEKLAHQLALISAAPRPPDLVLAAYRSVDFATGQELRIRQPEEDPWLGLVDSRWGITSSNLWRREAVLAAGGWDESRWTSEDVELLFRILKADGSVLCDRRPLVRKRERPDSLWHTNNAASMERWWVLRCEIFEHIHSSPEFSEERRRVLASAMLRRLRAMYPSDPDRAAALHEAIVRGLGDPRRAGSRPVYTFLYHTLGFRQAERVMSWSRGLRRAVRARTQQRRLASCAAG